MKYFNLFLFFVFFYQISFAQNRFDNLRNDRVTVYSKVKMKGNSQVLSEGRYDINQLTIGNDIISSILVLPDNQFR
jgi:hypothetical protein